MADESLDDLYMRKTEELHVGDLIRHPNELGLISPSNENTLISKILAIDPDETHKLVLDSGILLPDSAEIRRVSVGADGSLSYPGYEMPLAAEAEDAKDFGVSFRLQKEGDVAQRDVLANQGEVLQKKIDGRRKYLDSLTSEDVEALGSRKRAAQSSCSSDESIGSDDSPPSETVNTSDQIRIVSTDTDPSSFQTPGASPELSSPTGIDRPTVEGGNAPDASPCVPSDVSPTDDNSATELPVAVSYGTPPCTSDTDSAPSMLPDIPYAASLTFSLLNMDAFTVKIQPTSCVPDVLAWISAFLRQSQVDETWVPDEKGHEAFLQIPLTAYSSMLNSLRGKTSAVITIPTSHLTFAERARQYSTMIPPNASVLQTWGVPPNIANVLMPMQRISIQFVRDNGGRTYIADGMGLGKTIQAIAAMMMYRHQWPLLVLCPPGTISVWRGELTKWLGNTCRVVKLEDEAIDWSKFDIAICSTNSADKYIRNRVFKLGDFRCVIVDEAHELKTESSKRSQAIVAVLRSAKRVILLSGTPAFANPIELWPQLHGIGSWFEDKKWFVKTFCDESEMSKTCRHMKLNTALRGTVMVRREKSDCIGVLLPPKKRFLYEFEPSDCHLVSLVMASRARILKGRGTLAAINRESDDGLSSEELDSILSETSNYPVENGVSGCYKNTGLSKVSKVVVALQKFLENERNGKLCIFAHHKEVLDKIAEGAELTSENSIRIDMQSPTATRGNLVSAFQTKDKVRVALLGIKSAGVALSFTSAATVWFAELSWSPSELLQAEDRVHRMPQQAAQVNNVYFIAKGTFDEDMYRLVEKKYEDVGEFVNGEDGAKVVVNNKFDSLLEVALYSFPGWS